MKNTAEQLEAIINEWESSLAECTYYSSSKDIMEITEVVRRAKRARAALQAGKQIAISELRRPSVLSASGSEVYDYKFEVVK
jgi:hypothetical protein